MGACASPQNEEAHHEDTSWRRDFCASTSGIARKLVPTNPWSKVVIEYSSNGGRMPDHISHSAPPRMAIHVLSQGEF